MAIEAEGQVADVQVDGQGDQGESPSGDIRNWAEDGEADQTHAVAQSDPLAKPWVGDGHHAVAPARIVLSQVPAQSVEMRKLPRVEDSTQQEGT